jgi:inositol phosphorylceramide mannosyltransferase catalytic subunit
VIPRIIHQVWVGPPMPAELQAYCAGWRARHPGWEYRLWQERDIDAFALRNRALYDRAGTVAPGSEGPFRADLVRYEVLLRYGGVYIDCDIEACKPIDPILAEGMPAFAVWEKPGRWISNAVMGAEAGTPLLDRLVTGLPANVSARLAEARRLGRQYRPNILSGPQYLTAIYQQQPDALTVLPKDWFHPYLFSELERGREAFSSAYGVHHWHDRRTRRGIPR